MKHITYLLILSLSVALVGCKKDDEGTEMTINKAPEASLLETPTNKDTSTVWNPLFNWKESSDADGDTITYSLQTSTDNSSFSSLATGLSVSEYQIDDAKLLDPDTEYFWKVIAHDNQGNSTESQVFSFTTKDHFPDKVTFQLENETFGYHVFYNENNLIELITSFGSDSFKINNQYFYDDQNRLVQIIYLNAEKKAAHLDIIYTGEDTFQFTKYDPENPSNSQVISFFKNGPRYFFTIEQTNYRGEFYLDDNNNILTFWRWDVDDLEHKYEALYDAENKGLYINQSFILNLFPLVVPLDYTLPLLGSNPVKEITWVDANGNYIFGINHNMNNTFLGNSLLSSEAIKAGTDEKSFDITIDY